MIFLDSKGPDGTYRLHSGALQPLHISLATIGLSNKHCHTF